MYSILKVHNGVRSVIIELLRKAGLAKTGWVLKNGQRIANKIIGQQQLVECVKQGRCVWCKKTQQKSATATSAKCDYMSIASCLIMQPFWKYAMPYLVGDADKHFMILFQV